jgi:hypothetical protein
MDGTRYLFKLVVFIQTLLVSGGNDGLLTFWSVDNAREATPKLSVKVSAILVLKLLAV